MKSVRAPPNSLLPPQLIVCDGSKNGSSPRKILESFHTEIVKGYFKFNIICRKYPPPEISQMCTKIRLCIIYKNFSWGYDKSVWSSSVCMENLWLYFYFYAGEDRRVLVMKIQDGCHVDTGAVNARKLHKSSRVRRHSSRWCLLFSPRNVSAAQPTPFFLSPSCLSVLFTRLCSSELRTRELVCSIGYEVGQGKNL